MFSVKNSWHKQRDHEVARTTLAQWDGLRPRWCVRKLFQNSDRPVRPSLFSLYRNITPVSINRMTQPETTHGWWRTPAPSLMVLSWTVMPSNEQDLY